MPLYSHNNMNSKEDFFETISSYYHSSISKGIPEYLLMGMCTAVTDYYYEQYTRFYKQYPKSQKRYSAFHLKDIDHPSTTEIIIRYFKEQVPDQYLHYSSIALQLTIAQVKEFEKRREDFYRMF